MSIFNDITDFVKSALVRFAKYLSTDGKDFIYSELDAIFDKQFRQSVVQELRKNILVFAERTDLTGEEKRLLVLDNMKKFIGTLKSDAMSKFKMRLLNRLLESELDSIKKAES